MRPYQKLTPIEVRAHAHDSFKTEEKLSQAQVLEYLSARICGEGRSVTLHNSKNQHIIVVGNARKVHYYGTTGTVYAEAEGEFPVYRLRGMAQLRALERVVGLANVGH